MDFKTILYEKSDGIATMTFNRPSVRNAINYQMVTEMTEAIADARGDNTVRVLIITGAGAAFNSGDDVNEIFMDPERETKFREMKMGTFMGTYHEPFLNEFPKPTIAAVNGPAVGSGFDMALSCDIRIASETARFGYTYVRMGIIGTPLSPMLLPHLMGLSNALEFMLSGRMMDAAEAKAECLVSRVVPSGCLLAEARDAACKLKKAAPLSQQAIKRVVYRALLDPRGYAENMNALLWALFESEDHIEAVRAFAEKRPPRFNCR